MTRPGVARSGSIEASKVALRDRMARRRAGLEPREASRAGSEMAKILLAHPEWLQGSRIGLFAGLPDEPDTRPMLAAIQRAGKEAFFPRCRDDGGLGMARIDSWSDLQPSRFGILEPLPDAVFFEPVELDLILLPGVAFDRSGRRLGRGRGFYDRGLARAQAAAGPRRLGVGFDFQLVERVPVGELDQPVHGVLTERGLLPVTDPG